MNTKQIHVLEYNEIDFTFCFSIFVRKPLWFFPSKNTCKPDSLVDHCFETCMWNLDMDRLQLLFILLLLYFFNQERGNLLHLNVCFIWSAVWWNFFSFFFFFFFFFSKERELINVTSMYILLGLKLYGFVEAAVIFPVISSEKKTFFFHLGLSCWSYVTYYR